LEVPLIRDIYGLTVLDLILGLKQEDVRIGFKSSELRDTMFEKNLSFLHYKKQKMILNKKGEPLSEQYAQIIFSNIKNYGLLHSGDVIS
jgi:hypothetical protein